MDNIIYVGDKMNIDNQIKKMLGTSNVGWEKFIDKDFISWKKGNQEVSISLSNDGYWVVYGEGMGAWGQGFEKKTDAINFVKSRYNINE